MRVFSYPLQFTATTPAGGIVQSVRDLQNIWVQYATAAGTFAIDVSFDGVHYQTVATISATGLTQIPQPASHLRVRATSGGTGSLIVINGYYDGDG